jgi:phosphohistidine swiveling domain-containing protein
MQEDIIKIIYSRNWEIRVHRPGFVQSKQIVLEGLCQNVKLTKNISIFNKNNIWIKTANLYDADITNQLLNEIFPAAFKEDKDWAEKIIKEIDKIASKKDKVVNKLNDTNWDNANKKEIINCLINYFDIQKEIPKYYALAVPLANYCEKIIKENDESLLAYATQYKALDMDIMNKSLLNIKELLDKNKQEKAEKAISNHLKEFYWIKNNYNIAEQYTEEDVKHELNSHINSFEPVRCPANPIRHIVTALQVGIYLRNRMKEMLQQVWSAYEILLPRLTKETNLSREEILQLEYRELLETLKDGKLTIDKSAIKERQTGFITGIINEKPITITGEIVNKLFIHFTDVKIENVSEIKGSVASPGLVKGKAKVIHKISELNKLEKGDILITSMTTPDFIVGMKKASAIITDEGGLSCHAAIVSRELHIPCVIGTKIATKIINDGDLVEVDANKGIIKILEKAK